MYGHRVSNLYGHMHMQELRGYRYPSFQSGTYAYKRTAVQSRTCAICYSEKLITSSVPGTPSTRSDSGTLRYPGTPVLVDLDCWQVPGTRYNLSTRKCVSFEASYYHHTPLDILLFLSSNPSSVYSYLGTYPINTIVYPTRR